MPGLYRGDRSGAHGDGLENSGTTPDAVEEMIWNEFWSDQHQRDQILTWSFTEVAPDFGTFLESHMRKVVVIRREDASMQRVRFETLTENPDQNLARLADAIGIEDSALVDQADRIRPPRTYKLDASQVETAIFEEARELYGEPQDQAVIH